MADDAFHGAVRAWWDDDASWYEASPAAAARFASATFPSPGSLAQSATSICAWSRSASGSGRCRATSGRASS